MSEKIDSGYNVVPPTKGSGGPTPREPGTAHRSFADLLAEAETVRDAVHLSRPGAPPGKVFSLAEQPGGATLLWWGPRWSGLVPWTDGIARPANPRDPDPPDENGT